MYKEKPSTTLVFWLRPPGGDVGRNCDPHSWVEKKHHAGLGLRKQAREEKGTKNISSLCLQIMILMDDSGWFNSDLKCALRWSLLCIHIAGKIFA